MTRVVDIIKEPFDVYIGRYHPKYGSSKWRNPFKIGKDGTPEEVIEKFRQYLLNNPKLMAQLPELKGKTLGCWCKPDACHGDVLVELVEEMEEKEMTTTVKEKDNLDYSFGKKILTKEEREEIEPYDSLSNAVTQLQPSFSYARKKPQLYLRPEVVEAAIANRDDIIRYIKWKEKAPRDVFYNRMRAMLGVSVNIETISVKDGNKALSELMFLYDEINDGETEYQNLKAFADAMIKGAVRKMKEEKEEAST